MLAEPVEIQVWRIASEVIAAHPGLLPKASLVSLDHDLYRQLDSGPDSGCGRGVSRHMARFAAPSCPVIVHSTNVDAAWGMIIELRHTGWTVEIIHHLDEAGWIESRWLALAQQMVAAGR